MLGKCFNAVGFAGTQVTSWVSDLSCGLVQSHPLLWKKKMIILWALLWHLFLTLIRIILIGSSRAAGRHITFQLWWYKFRAVSLDCSPSMTMCSLFRVSLVPCHSKQEFQLPCQLDNRVHSKSKISPKARLFSCMTLWHPKNWDRHIYNPLLTPAPVQKAAVQWLAKDISGWRYVYYKTEGLYPYKTDWII